MRPGGDALPGVKGETVYAGVPVGTNDRSKNVAVMPDADRSVVPLVNVTATVTTFIAASGQLPAGTAGSWFAVDAL